MQQLRAPSCDGMVNFRYLGGSGPEVLLIHGFGADRMSWLANVPALLPKFRVNALELPGHGDSGIAAQDVTPRGLSELVEAELDERGLSSVHVVGHSLGAGLAMLVAERRSDLIASLAMIAPAGLGKGLDGPFLRALPEVSDVAGALALLRKLVARPQIIGKAMAERMVEHLARPGVREILARMAEATLGEQGTIAEAACRLAGRTIPHLTVWGRQDAVNRLSPPHLEQFGGAVDVMDGVGHIPHIENPRPFNAMLIEFLQTAAATRT